MSKVRILPDILSNKIAAGEVVERPASVVKELVENAIDAGSTRIFVDVEKGGRSLIRVSDNGSGLSRDDAILAIERYATSKIYTDEDLFSIGTLGFRGEALPSIASVSDFTLVSREQGTDSGTSVTILGGKIKNVTDAGAPEGTMITVKKLFFNTPARRKFLKTESTEMSHIAEVISCVALGWPKVQFRLTHNGKVVKNWPKAPVHVNRVVDVLGRDMKDEIHELDFTDDYVSIKGWISSPDMTRSSSQKIYIFVNGRYIRDRGLQYALLEAYRGRLMKGRYPLAVLFIDIPYDQLDVNVHPTKHEVRFANQSRIYNPLKAVAQEALASSDQPLWAGRGGASVPRGMTGVPEPSQANLPGMSPADAPEKREDYGFSALKTLSSHSGVEPGLDTASVETENEVRERRSSFGEYENGEAGLEKEDIKAKEMPAYGVERARVERAHAGIRFQDLFLIGQHHNTYLLCSSKEGLILIDQHAAHERVVFEELSAKAAGTDPAMQRLLIPETFDVSHREQDLLEKLIPELARTGLLVEHFGGSTFVIKAVPAILSQGSAVRMVTDILDSLMKTGVTPDLSRAMEESLILMSCHGAIRAGASLTTKEMETLLVQLDACENPSSCPHGRPTWIKWTDRDLEKSFKRVV